MTIQIKNVAMTIQLMMYNIFNLILFHLENIIIMYN